MTGSAKATSNRIGGSILSTEEFVNDGKRFPGVGNRCWSGRRVRGCSARNGQRSDRSKCIPRPAQQCHSRTWRSCQPRLPLAHASTTSHISTSSRASSIARALQSCQQWLRPTCCIRQLIPASPSSPKCFETNEEKCFLPASPKAPGYADFLPRALNSGFWEQPLGPRDRCNQHTYNTIPNPTDLTDKADNQCNSSATSVEDRRVCPDEIEVACSDDLVDTVIVNGMQIATDIEGLASSPASGCMNIDFRMSNPDLQAGHTEMSTNAIQCVEIKSEALIHSPVKDKDPGGMPLCNKLIVDEIPHPEQDQSTSGVGTAQSVRRAKPPPGKPPPAKAPPLRGLSGVPNAKTSMPKWVGPSPSMDWKTERVVNWQPIRHLGRWEGSVWHQVYNRMQDGFEPLPDDMLTRAFMQRAGTTFDPQPRCKSAVRRLPHQKALTADLLHAKLLRSGIHSPQQLHWIFGSLRKFQDHGFDNACSEIQTNIDVEGKPKVFTETCPRSFGNNADESPMQAVEPAFDVITKQSTENVEEQDKELPEDVLETLLGFLSVAAGVESHLCGEDEAVHGCQDENIALPPAENFLRSIFMEIGPVSTLQPRLEMVLHMARFPADVAAIECQLRTGLDAVQAILGSCAIPQLLEGMLLLGNYVNAGSKCLGGVVGVTLSSLAKLAHTRCIPDVQKGRRGQGLPPREQQHDNALHLLVRHLEQKDPGFTQKLAVDLEGCCKARDLDPNALVQAIRRLDTQVNSVEECMRNTLPNFEGEPPPALKLGRLLLFLDGAKPMIKCLRGLLEELDTATVTLRKYFAEPPTINLAEMLQCLGALREALPRKLFVVPAPSLPQHRQLSRVRPRKTFARHYRIMPQRVHSAPARLLTAGVSQLPACWPPMDGDMIKLRRSTSYPFLGCNNSNCTSPNIHRIQ